MALRCLAVGPGRDRPSAQCPGNPKVGVSSPGREGCGSLGRGAGIAGSRAALRCRWPARARQSSLRGPWGIPGVPLSNPSTRPLPHATNHTGACPWRISALAGLNKTGSAAALALAYWPGACACGLPIGGGGLACGAFLSGINICYTTECDTRATP